MTRAEIIAKVRARKAHYERKRDGHGPFDAIRYNDHERYQFTVEAFGAMLDDLREPGDPIE